jgi:hypothetical protein
LREGCATCEKVPDFRPTPAGWLVITKEKTRFLSCCEKVAVTVPNLPLCCGKIYRDRL